MRVGHTSCASRIELRSVQDSQEGHAPAMVNDAMVMRPGACVQQKADWLLASVVCVCVCVSV